MTKSSTAPTPFQRPADAVKAGRSLREWTSEGRPSRSVFSEVCFEVVSDGRAPLRVKRREAAGAGLRTLSVSLNRGWYRGFFVNSSPTEKSISVGDFYFLKNIKVRISLCFKIPLYLSRAYSPVAI